MHGLDRSRGPRLAAHGAVCSTLSRCSDHAVEELLAAATRVGTGIGGDTLLVEIDEVPVFVKQVPLTSLELQPENLRSTANLYELPTFCHYGVGTIGSPGFGAWRELAVHTMTTNWVIAGAHDGFPLMYHWRILRHGGRPLPDELADVDRAVTSWGGSPQVRRRIVGLQESTASLLLFLEYIPQNLHDWLGTQLESGDEAADRACTMVDNELSSGIAFMNERGLLHFDAHFENILTDGTRLYFADYGLAISSRFELAAEEADFARTHRDYDRAYAATHLVNWLSAAIYGHGPEERAAFVNSCAAGVSPAGAPPVITALLLRYGPVAAAMGEFYRQFRRDPRQAPYPAEEVRQLLSPSAGW